MAQNVLKVKYIHSNKQRNKKKHRWAESGTDERGQHAGHANILDL